MGNFDLKKFLVENKLTVKVKFIDGSQININKQYRVKTESEMNEQNIITSIIHQGI